MDIFPARLKAARKAKNLTQRDLAGLVNMDQGHISRLESGGKGVSMEHLQALAKELGVTISHLLGEEILEDTADYSAKGERATILANYQAPNGLKDFASDSTLTNALKVTDEEWRTLSSIRLPSEVKKDGYVQLLITLRVIS